MSIILKVICYHFLVGLFSNTWQTLPINKLKLNVKIKNNPIVKNNTPTVLLTQLKYASPPIAMHAPAGIAFKKSNNTEYKDFWFFLLFSYHYYII